MFKVEMPKILFLALDIASFYRNNFFNTNDLAELSNRYKSNLVRLREDKKDYKYLNDTRFGGLRGNFSTLLTWRGLVRRGSGIVNSYSLGKDNRLLNAICNGKIILNHEDFTAHTNDERLKNLLETEAWLLNVREAQAHVKILLENNPGIPLQRDNINFPKEAVFKSLNGQYLIRSLVNNFLDVNNKILQFSIINLWAGKKFRKKNIHPLIVLPTKENPWDEIFAIKNEDLLINKPILLNVNLETKECVDKNGNTYKLYSLLDALNNFSKEDENIENRLGYDWDQLKERYCDQEVDPVIRREDEFSNFLRLFLDWQRHFYIDGKEVIDIKSISSGGPDIELSFSDGTIQKLELEHSWKNYLDHGHQNQHFFNGVWIFSEEEFNFKNIYKIFHEQRKKHGNRIPEIFLSVDKANRRHVHKINWENRSFKELSLKFQF